MNKNLVNSHYGRALIIPAHRGALRSNNFDAIRLTMAVLVIWSHSFALWFGTEDAEPISLALGGVYNSGSLAVLVFFVISGFLITLSYTRSKSAVDFLKRRTLRIIPGYFVAISLCSLVVVPMFSSRSFGVISPHEVLGMISNLWLRNFIISSNAFGGQAVNGSLWSIPFEFWCYLGVMGLGLTGLLTRKPVLITVALLVMAVRIWLDITGRRPFGGWIETVIGFPFFWFNVLPPFALGGAAYIYRAWIPRRRIILAALISATLLAPHVCSSPLYRTVIVHLLVPPTLVYVTLYTAFSERIHAEKAAMFGDFSYGTYLYAFPIQRILSALYRGQISFPTYVVLSVTLSLVAGVASWYLVERWFLHRVLPAAPASTTETVEQEAPAGAPG